MQERFSLTGRVVLVTGGTRGIGRAISLQLARAGARVVANYARNEEAASQLAAAAAGESLAIEVLRADLTMPKGQAAVLECLQNLGGPLSVIHCAATGVHKPFEQLTVKHWDWTMALNVRAFFELMRALAPALGEGSMVVVMSSAGARRAVPHYVTVGSSKGALESLARHLAVELAPRGVRVNILAPGSVLTEAWNTFPDKEQRLAETLRRVPTGRMVTVEEVADAAHFLCSPAARGLVGHTLIVDGGHGILE